MAAKIFHPLLALIASASNNELAKYVEFLKEENKILRARVPGQIHTKPHERSRLVKLGKALGQAIEELITLVASSTFYRWATAALVVSRALPRQRVLTKDQPHSVAVEETMPQTQRTIPCHK